jgi:uncharacterized protein (DUF488 family)
MTAEKPLIFTIGHSTHALEEFVTLLRAQGITAVADVRSQPYSRLKHFNRENLAAALKAAGIRYVFLGRELGARQDVPQGRQEGGASYDAISRLPQFRAGLSRLCRAAVSHRLAIMCAEKEPLDCHRTILICRHLKQLGFRIYHILADGTVEEHASTEKRLVRQSRVERTLFEPDLTDEEILERAYQKRAAQIAYRPLPEEVSP